MKKNRTKFFRDPVHGFVEVYPHEREIIDSAVFQRLRRIHQLSFGSLVYHGAEHSRFGHSIGVMHLASRMLENALRNTSEYETDSASFDQTDERKLRVAALLHDVGHPPFSHGLERSVFPKHENFSSALIEGPLASLIEKAEMNPKEISSLVQGVSDPKKSYLAKILSSQLDADRMDYLTRDSHYTGVMYGIFDLQRLILSIAIKDGNLVVLQKGLYAADQFLISRFYMYEQVYLHRVKRAFEGMARIFAESEKHSLDYPSEKELGSDNGLAKFLSCDDDWFMNILNAHRDTDTIQGRIADQIMRRIPYKKIIDSDDIRHIYAKREGWSEDTGRSGIDFLRKTLTDKLDELKVNSLEILYDSYRNLPLILRPYSKPAGPEATEEESYSPIRIYDDQTNSLTPIEDISIAIKSLSVGVPRITRIYSARSVYDKVNRISDEYKKSIDVES
jgi:HD superfamily phosphohydrolase